MKKGLPGSCLMRNPVFSAGVNVRLNGAIAQLVERYNGIVEVRSSTLLSSTFKPGLSERQTGFFCSYPVWGSCVNPMRTLSTKMMPPGLSIAEPGGYDVSCSGYSFLKNAFQLFTMRSSNILWSPSADFKARSNLRQFENWLIKEKNLSFEDYQDLWSWSVNDISSFWECIWHYFEIQSHTPYTEVVSSGGMPGTQWFQGATLNYAEHVFRNKPLHQPALHFINEGGEHQVVTWGELAHRVAKVKAFLADRGIGKGDRVVAYLPNIPEAIVIFLATNALGAVWSCCSPDFGVQTVIDRFSQIDPVCFFAVDGYTYGGKAFSRLDEARHIQSAIPSIKHTVLIENLGRSTSIPEDMVRMEEVLAGPAETQLSFTPVPFDHPIWVLYSSGTTGKPKAITHAHGGVLLEHYKYLAFHNDVKPGENFFWFTTTGWMMWNFLQASMLVGAVPVLYDGSPGYPDLNALWDRAASLPIHHFGTSAPYLIACMKEGLLPGSRFDLASLRSIGSTGAPLPAEAFDWVYEAVSKEVWLCSMSGGTDVCTAFVGGNPYSPVQRGRIQAMGLGCALAAYDEAGQPVINQLGEMVIEKPMPSMPVYFWNDPGGKRYQASYFETFPGVWRHGDWIKIFEDGSLIIQGRSDATLNRKGVRIGTAEIYALLDQIDWIQDSLVLDLESEKGGDVMPLFIVTNGDELTESQRNEIRVLLRKEGSPRHVPDMIMQVPSIPYTLSGKKMEVPVKKILLGMPAEKSMNKDAVRNPEAIEHFTHIAAEIRKTYLE